MANISLRIRIYLLLLLCALRPFSALCAGPDLPYFLDKDLTPVWYEGGAQKDLHSIAAFGLKDQQGKPFGSGELAGKVWVADFFFSSCPGLCKTLSNHMQHVQEETKGHPEITLVSISVLPENDSPDVLQAYAKEHGADPARWHLLTGEKAAIYELARNSFFADAGPKFKRDKDDFLHTENFYLIDREGHIRGVYSGMKAVDLKNLVTDALQLAAH